MFNATLQGWYNYYGRYYASELSYIWFNLNQYLVRWVRRKYKIYARHKKRAWEYLSRLACANPTLFVHWRLGVIPKRLNNGSGVS